MSTRAVESAQQLIDANSKLLTQVGSPDDADARNQSVAAFETLLRELNRLREPQAKATALQAAEVRVDDLVAKLSK